MLGKIKQASLRNLDLQKSVTDTYGFIPHQPWGHLKFGKIMIGEFLDFSNNGDLSHDIFFFIPSILNFVC